jgi:hypothetical protein
MPDTLQDLLDKRDELERAHADLCREINECHLSESSLEAKWRDLAFVQLERVKAEIEVHLDAERERT